MANKRLHDMKDALEQVLQSGHGGKIAELMTERRRLQREHDRIVETMKENDLRIDAHITEALSDYEHIHRDTE